MRNQSETVQNDVMLEASAVGEFLFPMNNAFNPFKSREKLYGLRTLKGDTAIPEPHQTICCQLGREAAKSQGEAFTHPNGVMFDCRSTPQQYRKHFTQESPKEIFFSPYQCEGDKDPDPKSSHHSIPSFSLLSLPFVENKRSSLPVTESTNRHSVRVVSRLPSHVGDSLAKNGQLSRSGSILSDTACYSPKLTSNDIAGRARGSDLRLALKGVQTMCLDPMLMTSEHDGLHEKVSTIVQGDSRDVGTERVNHSKRQLTRFHGTDMTRNRGTMSLGSNFQQDPEIDAPAMKQSPPPFIPLPPFSIPDDQGKNRFNAELSEIGENKSLTSTCMGMGLTPRFGQRPSQSSACSPNEARPKAPLREGYLLSPAKSHQLVLSCSSRIRPQSPRVPNTPMDRSAFGKLTPTSMDRKKIPDMKPPSTPRRKAKSMEEEKFRPSFNKGKPKSLKVESVFSVIWQRSPNSSPPSNTKGLGRTRSSSEPPVAVLQRRVVAGVGRRLRVDELDAPNTNKVTPQGRRKRDTAMQPVPSNNLTEWKVRSASGTRTPEKQDRYNEAAFSSELTSPNRFAAAPCHCDFPPISPCRKGTDVDLPPASPMRKVSSQKTNNVPFDSDHDLDFHSDIPESCNNEDGRWLPSQRRSSCF
jgi:hypothetical protein